MKLYKFETLNGLNIALAEFEKREIPIAKVKLLSESRRLKLVTVFYILTNEKGNYQKGKTEGE